MTEPQYVAARRVLLDALEAVRPHLDSLILVGAQAIYVHAGDGDLTAAPFTTDADLSLDPRTLGSDPLLEDALRAANFSQDGNPGRWVGSSDVVVDLMVPDSLAGPPSRRSAHIPPHAKETARRAIGLEAALIDKAQHEIASLEANDQRSATIWVAGPAALLVAKAHKIHERVGDPNRTRHKDALDVLRLLRAVDSDAIAEKLVELSANEIAREVTAQAIGFLPELFGTRSSEGIKSAVLAAAPDDPETIAFSLIALTDDVTREVARLRG